ncbi:hypothetical protein RDJ12_03755 [Mergibacter septicus]|uniref:hypothetical protein n=1 Tax=Mergibacter septicus TaxID=221402 RepID=UPI0021C4142F|nr:hypothetical protein [Mergibacter septicus]UTU47291.1 hypothetical protein HLL31_02380 [Mergibacter septicus]WMR96888.1 hypothetical protein RDJ12_03755 [Mergibacter septicus]
MFTKIISFKTYFAIACFVFFIGITFYISILQHQLKQRTEQLKQATTEIKKWQIAYNQSETRANNFLLQQTALLNQLEEMKTITDKQQRQLERALENERNQNWSNQLVPFDIRRVFNTNTTHTTTPTLPAKPRMQKSGIAYPN